MNSSTDNNLSISQKQKQKQELEHSIPISIPWTEPYIIYRKLDYRGYVRAYVDNNDYSHPMVTRWHYIAEHRIVMARHIGRCLFDYESVHHINGIRDDNRIENLELLERSGHAILHNPSLDSLIQNIKCSQCGSSETYTQVKSNGKVVRRWRWSKTIDGQTETQAQIICSRCSDKNQYIECRNEELARTRKWRDSHKEHVIQYRKQNRDRTIQLQKNWYQRNRERLKGVRREYDKIYRQKNRSKLFFQQRDYCRKNKDRINLRQKDYRHRNWDRIHLRERDYYHKNRKRILLQQRNAKLRQKIFSFPGPGGRNQK